MEPCGHGGTNDFGQLGDNTFNFFGTPVQATGLTNVVAIDAGAYHSLALKSDGTVWAWGLNMFGQLGDNTTTDSGIPVQVHGILNAKAISGGEFFTSVITGWQALFNNTVNGNVAYWLMDNATQSSYGRIAASVPSEWSIIGQADLNLDGWDDIIWQSSTTGRVVYWLMNGWTQISNGIIAPYSSTDWKLRATIDLDSDGDVDFVWQNNTTGEVSYWTMNGTTYTGTWGYIARYVPSDWSIVGSYDFNNDSKSDLLWHNSSTGDVVYWLMNGTSQTSYGTITTGVSTQLEVVGAPMMGAVDIVWRNTSTGDLTYQGLSGYTIGASNPLYTALPTDWIFRIAK